VKIQQSIVVYDGECSFCFGIVGLIRKKDRKGRFLFLSNRSDDFKALQMSLAIVKNASDSILFLKEGHWYDKSTACIGIMKELGGIWKAAVILKIFPKSFRDFIYSLIARDRYSLFGKSKQCKIGG
jgi:predicted DCC family thiol-disulfide oxidoreductase YuxK